MLTNLDEFKMNSSHKSRLFRGSSGSKHGFLVLRITVLVSVLEKPGSIPLVHLFREAKTPVFCPFVNEILKLPFEYEHEYEKNQWYELPSMIMPDGPQKTNRETLTARWWWESGQSIALSSIDGRTDWS